MKSISPYINIKPDKMEFISQHLCSLEEVIFASKVQLSFPPKRNLPAQAGYAILTYGFMYLFIKNNKDMKLVERICLFNCEEIRFINEKSRNFKPSIFIKTLPDLNVYTISDNKKMDLFYEYISNSIFLVSNGVSSQMNIPKFYPPTKSTHYSVPLAIYKRSLYYIHYDMKQQKIPRTVIEGADYFNNPNIFYRGQLTILSSFHPGNFGFYYGKAIGMESQINSIKFQDFKEDLTDLFGSISSNSLKSLHVIFSDYQISAPVFNFEKVTNSKIESFEFINSNFCIVENFMNGCYNYSHNINCLKLSSIIIQQIDMINFFDCVNKIRCFLNLTSFELFHIKFGQFPVEIFREFLQLHGKLKHISISSIDAEGSMILKEILQNSPNLNELHLNYLNFVTPLNLDEGENSVKIPSNLVLIDFSHSKFKNVTMKPVLELLTSPLKNREVKTNLMVNMSFLQPRENTFVNAFKSLDLQKCESNIFDFNWSGNLVSSDLFNFLSTQRNLQFFSLNEINFDKPKRFYQYLTRFINESKIIGFEIGCNSFQSDFVDPFLNFCKDFGRFQHFAFQCQPEQNEVAEKVADVITSLSNLKEVSVIMPNLTKEAYMKVLNSITRNKSILACKLLNFENDKKEVKRGEIEYGFNLIRNLRIPTTMEQRASFSASNKKNLYVFDLASTIEAKCSKLENDEEEDRVE